MTKVVNLRKNSYDVYIGRAGKGKDGYFGNPFNVDEFTREESLEYFKFYFFDRLETDVEYKQRVLELKDKTLGCFCKPKACHGDIIASWLNKQKVVTKEFNEELEREQDDFGYLSGEMENI